MRVSQSLRYARMAEANTALALLKDFLHVMAPSLYAFATAVLAADVLPKSDIISVRVASSRYGLSPGAVYGLLNTGKIARYANTTLSEAQLVEAIRKYPKRYKHCNWSAINAFVPVAANRVRHIVTPALIDEAVNEVLAELTANRLDNDM